MEERTKPVTVSIIAAIGKNRELGKGNELLWPIPEDLKRFRAITMGHPIIMGRKTFESIGRALPGRTNIVITRDPEWKAPEGEGVQSAASMYDAIIKATGIDQSEVFIIGGGQIYEEGIKFASKLYLTLVDAEAEADTFFPAYDDFTSKTFEESHEWNGIRYTWVELQRAEANLTVAATRV